MSTPYTRGENDFIKSQSEDQINKDIDRVRLRNFGVYLEVLGSVKELLKYTYPKSKDEDFTYGKEVGNGKIFAVIGFSITNTLDDLPKCSVSLPTGDYIFNHYRDWNMGKDVPITDKNFDFTPVTDHQTYVDKIVKEAENLEHTQYVPCILWYKEYHNDMDVNKNYENRYKPIFKGITAVSAFTRVAYSQESINIDIRHYACLLDNVFVHNTLIDTQSDNSTNSPGIMFKLFDPVVVSSTSGNSDTKKNPVFNLGDGYLHQMLKSNPKAIDIFDATINFLTDQTNIYKDYKTKYDRLTEEHGKDLADIEEKNVEFVREVLRYFKTSIPYASAMTSDPFSSNRRVFVSRPELTQDNINGRSTYPVLEFIRETDDILHGDFNGKTYFQCLAALAKSFALHLVCTANTVSFEAIRYRTHTWPIPVIDSATCIVNNRTYDREIAASVVQTHNNSKIAGDSSTSTDVKYTGYTLGTSSSWGPVYVDPDTVASKEKLTLASMMIFAVPRWYNSGYYAGELAKSAAPNNIQDVTYDGHNSETPKEKEQDKQQKETQDKRKSLLGLTKALHNQAKALGKFLDVDMPFNINICVGMPICIKDSKHSLYSCGIVHQFTHVISRDSLTAQTTVKLAWIDTFKSKDADIEPPDNPYAKEEDDKNPFYTTVNAFTGRPMYV